MFERFTSGARRAVVVAQEIARAEGSAWIDSDHLAHGAFSDPLTITLLEAAGAKTAPIVDALRRPPAGPPPPGHIPFTTDAKKSLEQALRAAIARGHHGITGADIFLGVLDGKPDGLAAQSLAAQGIGRGQLHHAATGLPVVLGADDNSDVLRALASNPKNTPEQRRELEFQLVHQLIADVRLQEARELGERLLGEHDEIDLRHHLTAIGELTGDVDLIIQHATASIEADGSPNLHGSLALALALNDRGAEAVPHVAKALEAKGHHRHTGLLEAAEIALIAGDVERAAQHHAAVDPAQFPEMDLLAVWHLTLRAMIDERAGTTVVSQAQIERAIHDKPMAVIGQMHRARLTALAARRVLRTGGGRRAAKAANRAVEEARSLGMHGVAAEAMKALAVLQKEMGSRRWEATASKALTLATDLGRLADARRLQALLAE